MVLAIMERLNNRAVDNDDVEVYPSDYPLEYSSDYISKLDNTPIKSIDDDEMYQLLELFYLEHDDDILDVYLKTLQALIVVAPSLILYTVSTVLFHK